MLVMHVVIGVVFDVALGLLKRHCGGVVVPGIIFYVVFIGMKYAVL